VRNQYRLPRSQADNESLVAATAVVIRQDSHDGSLAFDLNIADLLVERIRKYRVVPGRNRCWLGWNAGNIVPRVRKQGENCNGDGSEQQLLHARHLTVRPASSRPSP